MVFTVDLASGLEPGAEDRFRLIKPAQFHEVDPQHSHGP